MNSREILRTLIEVNGTVCVACQKTNFDMYDFDFRQYFETKPVITDTALGHYWTEFDNVELAVNEKSHIIKLAEEISKIVDVPFLVVDLAKKADGDWIVIELNDGQESGYAGVNKLQLWQKIIDIERGNNSF